METVSPSRKYFCQTLDSVSRFRLDPSTQDQTVGRGEEESRSGIVEDPGEVRPPALRNQLIGDAPSAAATDDGAFDSPQPRLLSFDHFPNHIAFPTGNQKLFGDLLSQECGMVGTSARDRKRRRMPPWPIARGGDKEKHLRPRPVHE